MKIVGGLLKGRHLNPPAGKGIRPTPQIVREAIFDILGDFVEGANVLDLFAGTGALGLEALSRGASFCLFVDISYKALRSIRAFLDRNQLTDRGMVLRWDLRKGLPGEIKGSVFSLVFMDPPYDSQLAVELLKFPHLSSLLTQDAKIIVESRKGSVLPEKGLSIALEKNRVYGDTMISIYSHRA